MMYQYCTGSAEKDMLDMSDAKYCTSILDT